MPIIKCTVGENGQLIPSTVEFEPGDTIRFRSDHPVHLDVDLKEIVVRRAFNLDEISAELEDGTVEIHSTAEGWRARDLRTPPPPPPGVIIVVGHPKGGGQAGAAGTGS
jgi:hypothetical protein